MWAFVVNIFSWCYWFDKGICVLMLPRGDSTAAMLKCIFVPLQIDMLRKKEKNSLMSDMVVTTCSVLCLHVVRFNSSPPSYKPYTRCYAFAFYF